MGLDTMRPTPPATGRATRRVVAVTLAKYDELCAVCDDGAVFLYENDAAEWEELPPVPGTLRARQKERSR